jgi:hypothetical protein
MSTTVRTSVVIVNCVLLLGCAPVVRQWDRNDPQQIKLHTKISYDQFKKITKYRGPYTTPTETHRLEGLLLRAYKEEGASFYQIYVVDRYRAEGWRHYNECYDSGSKKLEITHIDRDVTCDSDGCVYTEELAINLTRDYLQEHQDSGLTFKLYGSGGSETFAISSTYIEAFLSCVPKQAAVSQQRSTTSPDIHL